MAQEVYVIEAAYVDNPHLQTFVKVCGQFSEAKEYVTQELEDEIANDGIDGQIEQLMVSENPLQIRYQVVDIEGCKGLNIYYISAHLI